MISIRHIRARIDWYLLSVPIYLKIVGIGALVAVLFGTVTLYQVQQSLTDSFYSDLEEKAFVTGRALSQTVTRPVVLHDVVSLYQILQKHKELSVDTEYVYILDSKQQLLAHSYMNGASPFLFPIQSSSGPKEDLIVVTSNNGLMFDVRIPILEGKAGWLHLGFSDQRIRGMLHSIITSFLIILIVCLVAGQGLAFLLTTILIRPINHLTQVSHEIRQGNFIAHAKIYSADEIGQLSTTFNQMADTLMKNQEDIKQRDFERVQLMKRIVTAGEEERKTIARELHDHMGPSLSAILLMIQSLKDRCFYHQNCTEDLEGHVRHVLDDMRRLAFTLRPSILDDYGLDSALRQYLDFIRKHSSIRIDYQCVTDEASRLPEAIETAFYRIAQESLSNILRHARAQNISVVILQREMHAMLLIEDDGVGFDIHSLETKTGRGMGLISMRERATMLSGHLIVESEPDKGTSVRVTVPLQESS